MSSIDPTKRLHAHNERIIRRALERISSLTDAEVERLDAELDACQQPRIMRRIAWIIGTHRGLCPYGLSAVMWAERRNKTTCLRLCKALLSCKGNVNLFVRLGISHIAMRGRPIMIPCGKEEITALLSGNGAAALPARGDVYIDMMKVGDRLLRYDTSELGELDPHTCYVPPGGHPFEADEL